MATWVTCGTCDEEYRVVGRVGAADTKFCPYCGSEVDKVEDDEAFPVEVDDEE